MDNLLKATVDSIAESDNEIGGELITRLREAHVWGRNTGTVAAGQDDLTDLTPVFRPFHVGLEVDLLAKSPLTGNEGRYRILSVSGESTPGSGLYYTATVEILGGGAVTWAATEEAVEWRVGDLRVETTFGFLDPPGTTDDLGQLAVGLEAEPVTYAGRALVPGAMVFERLGDPLTGLGYLTRDHREDTVVIESRRGYSGLDHLRRSFLMQYAEGEELDRIGRNYGFNRPLGVNDYRYRYLLEVVPNGPRGTVFMLELALLALYPTTIPTPVPYEDLANHPNVVFISLPELEPGAISTGRALFGDEESQTSATAQTVPTDSVPNEITSVRVAPTTQDLTMAVLPSAASPAWTYVNEGAVEGVTFSLVGGWLQQTMAGTADGGGYERSSNYVADEAWIEAWWRSEDDTTIAGRPWRLTIHDGEFQYGVSWSDAEAQFELEDGTTIGDALPFAFPLGIWRRVRLERRGDVVRFLVDGAIVLEQTVMRFDGSSLRKHFFGYLDQGDGAQTWDVHWELVTAGSEPKRNYWNLIRSDGALAAGSAVLTSALALFLAANADAGKYVRLRSPGHGQWRNTGLWAVTGSTTGTLTLDGIARAGARVTGKNSDLQDPPARLGGRNGALVILDEPFFEPADGPSAPGAGDGRRLVLSGSGSGNNGTYPVLEYLDPWTVRVDYAAGFVNESGLTWKWSPLFFATAGGVTWELVAAGYLGTPLGVDSALRDTLPAATIDVVIEYTTARSAQLLLNEFVENMNTTAPNLYFPFYLLDASDAIRALLDDLTAAGVIVEFARGY